MAHIGAALRTLALTSTTLSTAVGGTRFYAMMLPPEATMPAVSFMQISGRPFIDTCNTITTESRYQFTIFGNSPEQLDDLRDALMSTYHHYSGTVESVKIINIVSDLRFEVREPETDHWRQYLDFAVTYEGT